MSMKKKQKRPYARKRRKGTGAPMLLSAYNYKILSLGVFLIILGFGGMYIESQQYGFYSLYLAPLLVISGFILVAISVFITDPGKKNEIKTP